MHCIGSSLCFWINTIIDETLDTLVEKLTKSEDTCHPEDYHLIYGPDYYNNSSMIYGLIFISTALRDELPIVDQSLNIVSALKISKFRDTESDFTRSSELLGQFEECNVNNRANLVKNDTLHYLEMCTKKIYNWAEICYKADPSDPIVSFNVDCLLAKECMCTYDNHAANTIFRLGPFLYPFGIEFSLLVGKAINVVIGFS